MPATRETFFATCQPGIEPALFSEVKELRLGRAESQVGGVRFEGTMEDAWGANLCLRTAIRVLLRLSRFEARTGDELYRGVAAVEWRRFLGPTSSLSVSAQTRESRLDHSLFIEQRTKDAIVDQLRTKAGARPSVDKGAPDLQVHVHVSRDRVTLSVDTSGDSLHKRGWRRTQTAAPLSETLAAAMVLLSGWDRRAPLIDPFCGSGTILVEAALIASGIPPGRFREGFAFERLPDFDAERWRRVRARVESRAKRDARPIIRGVDVDPRAIDAARANLAAAGVADVAEVEVLDARGFPFKRGWNAWIVTNPPYGERVGSIPELRDLYREFGEILRERCSGYRLTLLSGNESLLGALAIPAERTISMLNGAIECRLVETTIGR